VIALPGLATFAAASRATDRVAACELCGSVLPERHHHVVEIGRRGVQCACRPCALLFERDDGRTRFRTVPDRVKRGELAIDLWAQMAPVGLAFFVRDSRHGMIVSYPGPAGIVDGTLDTDAWDAVAAATPLAAELAADVEALLVHGERGARHVTCYLVPITTAYELAGRLRSCWHGFSGGDVARRELAGFFLELDRRGARR
jgi:uncharacterized protein DUF5947